MFSSTGFAILIFHTFVLVLLVSAQPAEQPSSRIIVQGSVFCDVCSDNTFSKHSYFLSGVEVHVQCKFKASSPRTAEQISFSVNRTTNRYGVYKLDIPSVDGVDCIDEPTIQSFCQVSLIQSTSLACNVPGLKSTSNEVTIKSKQNNDCIYSLDALSYKPPEKNATLCGNGESKMEVDMPDSFNPSKFFLPYFPPYRFLWPPFQQPPLPQPLPQFPPLPPFPPFGPIPISFPPNLPFPFSPLPSSALSPPPAFKIEDPRTWIPKSPSSSPSQMPPFNPLDPKTWFPLIPSSPPADTNSPHP